MSNSVTIQTVFPNVTIPAGTTFSFCCQGQSPSNFYAYSVSSASKGVLAITSGWYNAASWAGGPSCSVTNSSPAAVTFDLMLLTVGANQATNVQAEQIK